MSLTEPEVEAAPWEGQAAADEAPYRRQIAYLFERSRFYRDKLAPSRVQIGRSGRRPRRHRPAAVHREG